MVAVRTGKSLVALIEVEWRRLQHYFRSYGNSKCFGLGNEFARSPSASPSKNVLQTQTRKQAMMWCCVLGRWSLQGFAVYRQCKVHGERAAFDDGLPALGRGGRRVCEQRGNSIVVSMIGAAILWSWLCTKLRNIPSGSMSSQQPSSESNSVQGGEVNCDMQLLRCLLGSQTKRRRVAYNDCVQSSSVILNHV